MSWFGPSGSCGCCGSVLPCEDCDALTYFTIGGLVDPAVCSGGCTGKNGTYVFRTAGSYFETSTACGWTSIGTGVWGGNNCGADDVPTWYIGPLFNSCGSQNSWGIDFQRVGGLIRIRVALTLLYNRGISALGMTDDARSSYNILFQNDFESCEAAVAAGELPFFSSSVVDCHGGGTGDFCNLLGVSIGLG